MPEELHDRLIDPRFRCAAEGLSDEQLIDLLAMLRTSASSRRPADAAATESAIAALECEAARRQLDIPHVVRERVPPRHALRCFQRAADAYDTDAMDRLLPYLDIPGIWRASRHVRALPDRAARSTALARLLFALDVNAFSYDFARQRAARLAALDFDEEGFETMVDQCIASVFESLLLMRDRGEETGR